MTLITAELSFFFFFSLCASAALFRFITSRPSSPFDFWPLFFFFFFWATPLEYCPLSLSLIFQIESEAWERRGRDSTHCFHLCNTAMISPAVGCQPRLGSSTLARLHQLRSCC